MRCRECREGASGATAGRAAARLPRSRWWLSALAAAALLALCGTQPARAQPPPRAQYQAAATAPGQAPDEAAATAPGQAPDDPGAPALVQAVRNGWIRLEMAAGRMELVGLPVGNVSTSSSRPGLQERLSVRNTDGRPALDYERTSPTEKLTVNAEGDRFRIVKSPVTSGALASVEFSQQPDEPLTLGVRTATEQRVYRARSLWHLLIVHSEPCRKHLLPLVETLRPDWNLTTLLEAIEDELRQRAAAAPPDTATIDRLVAQLADPQFGRREAAERRLRASSPAVLSYLEGLDQGGLDAEQRFRLGRTVAALRAALADTKPQEIAAWLSGDVEVWLALLERPDPATRQLAARQLESRLGEPLGVDPQCEPADQQAELARLRERLERAGLLPPAPAASPPADSSAAPSPPAVAPRADSPAPAEQERREPAADLAPPAR